MDEKQRVREAVRAGRADRDPASVSGAEASTSVTRELIAAVERQKATRVACFMSTQNEPDTAPFLAWADAQGIDVLLPKSQPDGTLAWALLSAGPCLTGAFGVLEPTGPSLPAGALATADLVFVPAAAVSLDGTRLGWGRGYYDRELAALDAQQSPPVLAVVYEQEIFPSLPAEAHDVPVAGVISEVRTRYFG